MAGVAIMGMIRDWSAPPPRALPPGPPSTGPEWRSLARRCGPHALSLGTELLLLLLGTSWRQAAAQAGAWMDVIKQLFGFLRCWRYPSLLSRLLSDQMSTLLWLGWGWCCAVISITTTSIAPIRWARASALRPAAGDDGPCGGGQDLLPPGGPMPPPRPRPRFIRIQDPGRSQVQLAAARGKPVLLDLYGRLVRGLQSSSTRPSATRCAGALLARWCCCEADVTANDDADVDHAQRASTCWDCRPSSSSIAMATR